MRLTDHEIVQWLRGRPDASAKQARQHLGVGAMRVRRVAFEHGIELRTQDAEESDIYDELADVARECVESGYGLDNPLGTLVALVCGVPPEDVAMMACGGTVTIRGC